MRISTQLAFWMSLVFAALCVSYGAYGFFAIESMDAGVARDDARGFAWFWLFLGSIGIAMALVSRQMLRGAAEPLDE